MQSNEIFNDPKTFDFLQQIKNPQEIGDPNLRDSIYVKFDPCYLSGGSPDLAIAKINEFLKTSPKLRVSQNLDVSTKSSLPYHSPQRNSFTEEDIYSNEFHTPPESNASTIKRTGIDNLSSKRDSLPLFNPATITRSFHPTAKNNNHIGDFTLDQAEALFSNLNLSNGQVYDDDNNYVINGADNSVFEPNAITSTVMNTIVKVRQKQRPLSENLDSLVVAPKPLPKTCLKMSMDETVLLMKDTPPPCRPISTSALTTARSVSHRDLPVTGTGGNSDINNLHVMQNHHIHSGSSQDSSLSDFHDDSNFISTTTTNNNIGSNNINATQNCRTVLINKKPPQSSISDDTHMATSTVGAIQSKNSQNEEPDAAFLGRLNFHNPRTSLTDITTFDDNSQSSFKNNLALNSTISTDPSVAEALLSTPTSQNTRHPPVKGNFNAIDMPDLPPPLDDWQSNKQLPFQQQIQTLSSKLNESQAENQELVKINSRLDWLLKQYLFELDELKKFVIANKTAQNMNQHSSTITENQLTSCPAYIELAQERDQLLEDVKGVEVAFADLHRRYEKVKVCVENYKSNEELLLNMDKEKEKELRDKDNAFRAYELKAEKLLNQAMGEIEKLKNDHSADKMALNAKLRKLEMKSIGLERDLAQKTEENMQLHGMCDDLIAKIEQQRL